jgi:NitT/TauT family transport system ATP-binding protein/nitrate/nitrite transport system substrate-binding protein
MAETIRIGLLRLCDAAPVILADQEEIFARNGARVVLSVEPSWANIADKLGYGLLEGAVMLPPLAMACAAGLRGRKTDLVIPMSLSANGNAVTLASRFAEAYRAGGITAIAPKQRLRLAVVHAFSTHDLLLRYWLAAAGIDPEHEVDITVLQPAEMVGSLAAGAIDGFCAGAPWGQVANHAGLGFNAVQSREIWRDHPEKCLALRADFAARDPAGVLALLTSLRFTGKLCAAPDKRAALAALLGQPEYLDLPAELIATALDPATGGPQFTEQYPNPETAMWFAEQLARWHKAPADFADHAARLYRPDLYLEAGGTKPAARMEVFCEPTSVNSLG